MSIRTYTIKRKADVWEYFDSFEASCWFEGQKIFTNKMRKMISEKYVHFEDQKDAENFGFNYKGSGLYPIKEGDILLDKEIYNTFFDGNYYYTIKAIPFKH